MITQEKLDRICVLIKERDEFLKELEQLLSCDRDCCQPQTGRVYKKEDINSANIPMNITLAGTDQFTEHGSSDPILQIQKAVIQSNGCTRIIMNQKIYNALAIHPDIIGSFQKMREGGGVVKKDAVSTVIVQEISIQEIGNTIIIEKDNEPVYAIFQAIP